MKIFIYKTSQTVPFSELFTPLGNYNKMFLSNGRDDFASSQIRALLPNNLQNDESVFVVPEKWKDEFYTLLESKFNRTDYDWQLQTPSQKPAKGEISDSWSDEIAEFYESSELQIVDVLKLTNKIECIDSSIDEKTKNQVVGVFKSTSIIQGSKEDSEKNAVLKIDNILRSISFSIATGIYKASKFISIFVGGIIIIVLSYHVLNLKEIENLKSEQIPLLIRKEESAKQNDISNENTQEWKKQIAKLTKEKERLTEKTDIQDLVIKGNQQIKESSWLTPENDGEGTAYLTVLELLDVKKYSSYEENRNLAQNEAEKLLKIIINEYYRKRSFNEEICKNLKLINELIKKELLFSIGNPIESDKNWKQCEIVLSTK